jgi:hypothetical protein
MASKFYNFTLVQEGLKNVPFVSHSKDYSIFKNNLKGFYIEQNYNATYYILEYKDIHYRFDGDKKAAEQWIIDFFTRIQRLEKLKQFEEVT